MTEVTINTPTDWLKLLRKRGIIKRRTDTAKENAKNRQVITVAFSGNGQFEKSTKHVCVWQDRRLLPLVAIIVGDTLCCAEWR